MAESKKDTGGMALPADIAAALEERRQNPEDANTRMVIDLRDYYTFLDAGLRAARLALSPAEAAAVLDSYPRMGASVTQWTAAAMARQIEEACLLDGVADKWAVDGLGLSAKLAGLGDHICIALADWAARLRARENMDVATEIAVFKGQD